MKNSLALRNEKCIKTKRLTASFNSKIALYLFNKILNSMWIIIYSEFPFSLYSYTDSFMNFVSCDFNLKKTLVMFALPLSC